MRDDEIVCMCGAYDHPHRLSGGKCDGSAWVTAYRELDSFECQGCACENNGSCDVATGREKIDAKRCECVADELRTRWIQDEYGYLPINLETSWEDQQRAYYEWKYS